MDDWREVARYAEGTMEKVVGQFVWSPVTKDGHSYGVKIRIDVIERPNGKFQALPDRMVKTPQQASPYVSIDEEDTLEKALKNCISGFKMLMGELDTTTWPPLQ